jgi:tetratricopeptide (TPR) repeat protein
MVFVIMYLVYKSDPIQQTQSSHSSTAPSFSSAIGNFSFPVGYFLVALCYLGLRYTVLGGMGPQGIYQFFPEVSLPWRMVIGSTVFLYYLKLLLLPLPLNVDYVIPAMHFFSFSTLLFTGFGLLLYGILLSLKLCPLRRQHVSAERMLWSLSLGWIPLTLLPVLHILPIGTVMAERFLYIPSFGFTLLAGWVVTRGLESSRWTLSLCTSALLALLLVGYAVQTIQRNREWRDAKALWQQTITVSPQSHNAYNNLGVAYFLEGAFPEAIAAYETALRLKPANPLPYMNIGLILEQQGDLEQAIRYHQKALALNPAYAEAHLNLGVAYFKKGWIDQAIAEQQEAIRLYPTFAQAHSHLGLSYLKKGWLDKALEEQQIAVAVNPFSPEIQTNLGIIYYRLGRFSEAIDHFTRALALGPARSDLFAYLGAVYFAQGDISQAMQAYQKALELNPRNVQAHQYLGIIYLRQQQSDKAVIHWQNALRFGSSPQKVQEEIVTALVQLQDRAPGDQMLLQPEKGSRE